MVGLCVPHFLSLGSLPEEVRHLLVQELLLGEQVKEHVGVHKYGLGRAGSILRLVPDNLRAMWVLNSTFIKWDLILVRRQPMSTPVLVLICLTDATNSSVLLLAVCGMTQFVNVVLHETCDLKLIASSPESLKKRQSSNFDFLIEVIFAFRRPRLRALRVILGFGVLKVGW
jgi:hypothetical protein